MPLFQTPAKVPRMRGVIPLVDSTACHVGRSEKITARYDSANKLASRAAIHEHYRALKAAVYSIVAEGAHPFALSDVAARAVERGLPIDPHALFAPPEVLAYEARYIALAIPSLSNLHGDCLAWLEVKLRKPRERIMGAIPWNLVVGGTAIR